MNGHVGTAMWRAKKQEVPWLQQLMIARVNRYGGAKPFLLVGISW
jgi:hypothetical protein